MMIDRFLILVGVVTLCVSAQSVVYDYVSTHAKDTFREPEGYLTYPYLVPAGPYNQMWDWDSVFMGTALLPFGSAKYLAGSMKNFLDHTDSVTGEIGGCITPQGPTPTIHHAKPVIIQGAWIVAKYMNDTAQFLPFKEKMAALLAYWDKVRKDKATGLYVWYDQLESGADNLPTSQCPSNYSDCWVPGKSGLSLSATDIMTFMYREVISYANFLKAWAVPTNNPQEKLELLSQFTHYKSLANEIKTNLIDFLWNDQEGLFEAYNVSSSQPVKNRVYLMCLPVFGPDLMNATQVSRCLEQLTKKDMISQFGVRSTSSTDPLYSNDNIIIPYSNWRGPVWIVANAMLAYGFNDYGSGDFATQLAENVVAVLARDIEVTNTWHECYNSDTGAGLAAPGFLSWNTLGATLLDNIKAHINPFAI